MQCPAQYRKQGKRRHTRPGQRGRPICYRSSTLRYHQATSSTSYDARSHPAQSHHAADIQHQLYKAISEAKAFTGLRNALRTIGNKEKEDRHIQDNAAVLCYRSSTLRYHQATWSTCCDARSRPAHPSQSHHAADIQHQLYKAISKAKAVTGLH